MFCVSLGTLWSHHLPFILPGIIGLPFIKTIESLLKGFS